MIEKNLLTIAILEGIERSEGCPLCYLWLKSEKRHMEYLLTNEATMSPEVREKLLASKGFCNYHMHLLYKTMREGHTEDGLGYALYMQGVIKGLIEEIKSLPLDHLEVSTKNIVSRRRRRRQALSLLGDRVEHTVRGQQPCPACESLWESDEIHLHTLVQMLDDNDFREEFKSSKGLCLPHFLSVIRMAGRSKLTNPAHVAQTLIEVEIKRLQLVEHCLSEFARKQSWDFRHEPWGPEVNANPMVLNLLVGAEGLHCKSQRNLSQCNQEIDCEEIENRAEKENKAKLRRI